MGPSDVRAGSPDLGGARIADRHERLAEVGVLRLPEGAGPGVAAIGGAKDARARLGRVGAEALTHLEF